MTKELSRSRIQPLYSLHISGLLNNSQTEPNEHEKNKRQKIKQQKNEQPNEHKAIESLAKQKAGLECKKKLCYETSFEN